MVWVFVYLPPVHLMFVFIDLSSLAFFILSIGALGEVFWNADDVMFFYLGSNSTDVFIW